MKFIDGSWIVSKSHFNQQKNKAVLCTYKKEIEIERISSNYIIAISADSKYKCYINGEFVCYGPQKGNQTEWFYDSVDITKYLVQGTNSIVITVLSYPNKHFNGNHSLFRTNTPGLFVGSLTKVASIFVTDTSWKAYNHLTEIYAEDEHFAPLFIFEKAIGLVDTQIIWESVQVYHTEELDEIIKPSFLKERTIPFLTKEPKKFVEVSSLKKSIFSENEWNEFLLFNRKINIPPYTKEIIEIHAGEETTGFLRLILSKGKNTKITILTSECYAYPPIKKENGPLFPVKNDRTDSINGTLFGFKDYYIVAGMNREVYEPFWFRTFRYIQLEIVTDSEAMELISIDYLKNQYPLNIQSSIQTSDNSYHDIWDISERTLRCCMHETYEDCPFYEQLQYIMDSRSQILYTYATSMDDRLARRCMNDFKVANKFEGLLNACYPNFEENIIPGFSIYYIGMLYDHMMYFGDEEFLHEHSKTVQNILEFYKKRINHKGLVAKIGAPLFEDRLWSFIDWTPEWNETIGSPSAIRFGPITMESLLYLMGLQYATKIFEYLDMVEISNKYREDNLSLKQAVRNYSMDKDGVITDGPDVSLYSQHCQVFGILTGVISQDKGSTLLLETFNNKEKYTQCSVASMFYLFRALEICKLYDLTDKLWDTWRVMIKKNLTTCEEDSVNSRSDCHAWGALMLYELPSSILGVKPYDIGYKTIEINPHFSTLEWAKGSVITPHGLVEVDWKKVDIDHYKVNVRLPKDIDLVLCNDNENIEYQVYIEEKRGEEL